MALHSGEEFWVVCDARRRRILVLLGGQALFPSLQDGGSSAC
ncbi:hypothetical protein Gohar_014687 [Gossypium harknessii]|uniref:Uncharacterized protein n=1 Tax=Gossypium harknessii TaxID=34285 RepID=A0A7J9FXL5_9ROSI|nr:hypothetical protein [Gossypium harknessii]